MRNSSIFSEALVKSKQRFQKALRDTGLSDEPCDSFFFKNALSILGKGIHSCGDDNGFVEISIKEEDVEIFFTQQYEGYYTGDPDCKSVIFKNDFFQLVLISYGYGMHRVRNLKERIEIFKYIKMKTLLAISKEEEKYYQSIDNLPEFGMDMWP